MTEKLYIVEGPDCSGKTSLAKFMALKLPAIYWHVSGKKSLHQGMFDLHMSILENVKFNLENGHNVVLDRHWPSEFCYGTTLRPWLLEKYDFDAVFQFLELLKPIYVFCGDDEVTWRHEKNKNPEHPYDSGTFAAICGEYTAVEEQLNKPHVHYSITEHGSNMTGFVTNLTSLS